MGHGEHRDDLEDTPQARAEAGRRFPSPGEDQYGGQDESEDEQNVIGADPDVLDTETDNCCEAAPERRLSEVYDLVDVARRVAKQVAGFVLEGPATEVCGDDQQRITIGLLVDDAVVGCIELTGDRVELTVDHEVSDDVITIGDLERRELAELEWPFCAVEGAQR